MNKNTIIHHIALQYPDRKQAKLFFTKILELSLKKTFTISEELSESIFAIKEKVKVDVYANDTSYFEIFITKKQSKYNYEHISIEIKNKEEFIKKCKKYKILPIFVKKGEKTLLFIKDFANNLFEIKEKCA